MIEDVLYIHGKLDLLSGEEINRCLMSRANSTDETYVHFIQEPKTRGGRLCWSSCGVLLQRGILEGSTIKYYYFSFDQYRYLWTAIRGFISEFGLFSWRALSGQPTPCQALSFIMTTSKVLLPGVYRVEATIGKCRSSGLLRFNI